MKVSLILAILLFLGLEFQAQDTGKRKNDLPNIVKDSAGIELIISKAITVGRTDSSAADKIFRRAISKSKQNNDPHHAGVAYYEMGEMYFRYKNHNRSFGAFFNAKENFVKADSRKEIAYTNFALGRQQYYRGNYKISAGHLNYAMREAKQLQLKKLEADILEYMGILHHVMPNTGFTSTHLLRRALEMKVNIEDEDGALNIIKTLAGVYYDERRFDSALYFSNSAVTLSRKLKMNYDATLAQLQRIPSLLRLDKLEEAKRELQSVKTLAHDTSDLNLSIRYYVQTGNYCIAIDDTVSGIKNYDSAIQVATKAGFPELYALVYKNMADAYYHSNNFKKAYEYQLQYTRKMGNLYSADNYTAFAELQYIFKTNITEDEVKYLNVQNELKELRLKNERSLRITLLVSTSGFLISALLILLLYRKQRRKSTIIEKQGADLQVLMREIHHRVKNNLQVISSLLDLQSQTIGDPQAAEAIKESRNRVQTMALIHQDLYNETYINGIEMPGYINKLAMNLFSSYNVKKDNILLETNIDPVLLDIDVVIPIGFVLNELISNALKYAFQNKESGVLNIALNQQNGELLLKVKDDGVGFPPGLNIYQAKSFGFKLIKAFAQKLKARLEVYNDNGACVLLHIRKYKII